MLVGAVAAVALTVAPPPAHADAPPVGPLPTGPVTSIHVRHGLLFAIVVPRPAAAGHTGRTTVVYALTRGEGPKALQARYFRITVL